ncbi:MAG TPA: succinylglutamate desuccinylase/aspartoacylase family protein [Nitrososphaerales archaeon]|nr:succinylglutamate desuccinylase/aspartoacylase family protein [Nitrososphaerales archaeon]
MSTNETIKLGETKVSPGEILHTDFEVGQFAGFPVRIPLSVINGSKSGPTLCITSGLHGCEYDSIEAAIRITNSFTPERIAGRLIVLPIINLPSFQQKAAFVNPLDNVNMNRIFPGDPKGTISRRIASKIFSELVLQSNYLIDLHGGDLTESIQSHVMVKLTGNDAIDSMSRKMAGAFEIPYLWELEVSGIPDYPGYPKGTVTYEAPIRGIPAVTAEAGERGKLEERSVKVLYDGIVNVMRLLGMIPGEVTLPTPKKTVLRHGAVVSPSTGGFFYPSVSCGDRVEVGSKLGEVRDLRGNIKQTLTSQTRGIVLSLVPLMPANAGEFVVLIVEL